VTPPKAICGLYFMMTLQTGSQIKQIQSGVDILVETPPPGHVKDHLQNGKLNLIQLKHVVLDEVEKMSNMAYKKDSEDIPNIAFLCDLPSLVDYHC
jgi:superfamily II DNA/RNA helicase